jgi:hypothetical protein
MIYPRTRQPFKTPVLLLIFNRPELTRIVFQRIRALRPTRLFVSADGPRADRAGEAARCEAARAVTEAVDWECGVERRYLPLNLGCGLAVASGITWFFDRVEDGIILEDDVLPDPSFFPFCEALLERYRGHPRVMHISGSNVQLGRRRGRASYYASRYSHNWGWATWRSAWRHYDFALDRLQAFQEANRIAGITPDSLEQRYWLETFEKHRLGLVDNWDAQWMFTVWDRDGVALLPDRNLTSHIGVGPDATHARRMSQRYVAMSTRPVRRLLHCRSLAPNRAADGFTFQTLFLGMDPDR